MAAPMTYNHHHRYFSDQNKLHTTTTAATNLAFEFNELDIWNVTSSPEYHKTLAVSPISNKSVPSKSNRREVRRSAAMSLPVDVPDWSIILKQELRNNNNNNRTYGSDDDDDEDDEFDAVIPPHEYLARGRNASFSVHEGIGRTLKGRDLSRVRNAVWKQIGFED
ncbi:protein S40-4-like [Bidens hawaiensis]|uniref:protein S40-4-like n=1 Tax=Bidens hawaiensis TaxID=980011 RepID=UPI00404ACEDD